MKIKILLTLIAIVSVFAGFKYFENEILKKSDPDEKIEVDELENAILIDSLEEYSLLPPKEDDSDKDTEQSAIDVISDGIIYDEKTNQELNKILEKTNFDSKEVLKELRQKDGRWHYSKHKIEKGENLWTIAHDYKTNHKLIIRANDIKSPEKLKPGAVIDVPNRNGIKYTVKKGDTVSVLAKKYKITAESILESNKGKNNKLKKDDTLFLPDAKEILVKIAKKTYPEGKNSGSKNVSNEKITNRKISFLRPLHGGIDLSSSFGMRLHPINGTYLFHNGIDIRANLGTPVYAAGDGRIIFSGYKEGYGNMVVIQHKNNYITVYAHLYEIFKNENVYVKKGTKIALSGDSGTVTGAHLHFEVRKNNVPLNPMKMF